MSNYILLLGITIFLTIFSIYYYVKLIKNIFFEPLNFLNNNTITFYFSGNTLENSFLFLSSFLLIGGLILFDFNKLYNLSLLLQTICNYNII